ncbi:MAG: Na/Pi cotransporter family protein [Verrucomicrobiae bacterium]|nr:Na/Pi cotransporter family protein [Verrucomicrobiae bacterium]
MSYFHFLAGVALMLYGIRVLRKGSDRLFGSKLRQMIQSATQGRIRAFLTGFVVSILTPSSTAVALLSMEAINAGYVTFQQVLVFMLGANIGFTLTVQLLAFKFFIYNSIFIACGMPLFLFSRQRQIKGLGQFLLGIGFLLLSIQILSAAVAPLKESSEVQQIMRVLEQHPVWIVVFAILIKTMLQSATATIGIAIALNSQNILPLNAAIAVVIGTNIGIGVTALAVGYARVDTKRMALGNIFFKLVGAIIFLPLIPYLTHWLRPFSLAGDTQLIANAHSFFNIALAAIFLPLASKIGDTLEKLVPAKEETQKTFKPLYLDRSSLDSPVVALGQATREILHMTDLVGSMLRDIHSTFKENNDTMCKNIQQRDDQVDLLNTEIKRFLTKLSEQGLSPDDSKREVALLGFANELENIGDIIDKNLAELAEKRITSQVEFSSDGWAELDEFFTKVQKNFELAVLAFTGRDKLLAEQLLWNKQFINKWERELRAKHFQRLHEGLVKSHESSAIHLDVLTNLKRINSHLSAVAYPILENDIS